jgi:hypothetical protein
MEVTDERVCSAIEGLLAERSPTSTICPSEVARALSPLAWRHLMPQVRTVAFALAHEGKLEVRQRGRTVAPGEALRGPIRLGRPVPRPAARPTTPEDDPLS